MSITNWFKRNMPKPDTRAFWSMMELLDWTKTGDDEAVLKPVFERLVQSSDDEIFAFDEALTRLLFDIDSKKIAKAALHADEFLSDDGFLYARCVALVNGSAYYEMIIKGLQPLDMDMEFEAVLYLSSLAWAKKHQADQSEYPYETEVSYETGSNAKLWR